MGGWGVDMRKIVRVLAMCEGWRSSRWSYLPGGSRWTCAEKSVGVLLHYTSGRDECPFGTPFVDRTAFRLLTMRSHPRAFAQVLSLHLGVVALCGGRGWYVVVQPNVGVIKRTGVNTDHVSGIFRHD